MMGLVLIGFSSGPCFLVLEISASPSVSFHLNVVCESGNIFTSHQRIHVGPVVSRDGMDGYR